MDIEKYIKQLSNWRLTDKEKEEYQGLRKRIGKIITKIWILDDELKEKAVNEIEALIKSEVEKARIEYISNLALDLCDTCWKDFDEQKRAKISEIKGGEDGQSGNLSKTTT